MPPLDWVSMYVAGGFLMNDPLAYLIVALVTLFVFQMIEISGKVE